jgi:hypothetical protein
MGKDVCCHNDFEANVDVLRIVENDVKYSASIKVRCKGCKKKFALVGLQCGDSTFEPLASAGGSEVRVSIAEKDKKFTYVFKVERPKRRDK